MKLTPLSILLTAIGLVAALDLETPLANQLPTIARVDQPYTWTFSPYTFASPSGSIQYSAKPLPDWLHFDATTRTFSGTPSGKDVGHPEIVLGATDQDTTAYSRFSILVSSDAPPKLQRPISAQFHPGNPSLSSVFLVSPDSAIATSNPALRIPPKWSFSVGLEWDTFVLDNGLEYSALMADGTPLPTWITFNPNSITFNGYSPSNYSTLSVALHVIEQQGYSAASLSFDIIVAPHELSQVAESFPTINVTAGTSFSFTLRSPADFTGVLMDGKPISPSDVTDLILDVSGLGWLHYDKAERVLSGDTPVDLSHGPSLPVALTASNQTIRTKVSLALVASYFSTNALPPTSLSSLSQDINFSLAPYFSNATSGETRQDVNLTASIDPPAAQEGLKFDSSQAILSGHIAKALDASHISVTFTAYSRFTHSTSHTSLAIALPRNKAEEQNSTQTRATHSKLVRALSIVFGIFGGICVLGAVLAWSRRCLRVEDTALVGEEGRQAWSEKDKKWYGLSPSSCGRTPNNVASPRPALEMDRETTSRTTPNYIGLGLGSLTPRNAVASPGFMSKKDFLMARVKEKVRQVSGSSKAPRKRSPRPVIGKPILRNSDLENLHQTFHGRGSTILSGSPSGSTGNQSLPRQRPEFAPPASPAQVRFSEPSLSHQISSTSTMSLASIRTHAEEAVVQVATRASSIRSGNTQSVISQTSDRARPRLVPFTSARVPVPPSPGEGHPKKRITSLHAELHKVGAGKDAGSTADDLNMGLHYVRTLGGDPSLAPSASSFGNTRRSSFSSLESSNHGNSRLSVGKAPEMALLARVDERFSSRVPVHVNATTRNGLEVKQMSGAAIPQFLKVNLSDVSGRYGAVLFTGTPRARDRGKTELGVFLKDDETCVAQVVLEVVGRS